MDTRDLSLFVRAAQLGSITAAGRDIGLTPAAASARLQALERRLGARLLHRTTRRSTLTEDGRIFLGHAQAVIEAVEIAAAALGGVDTPPRGTIRLAAPASFGRMHIVPALPALLERFPLLRVDVRLSDRVVDMIEGGMDLAIRNAAPGDTALIGRKLAPDRRHLVASAAYVAARGNPAEPDDLAAHDCLVVGDADVWTLASPTGPQQVKVAGRVRIDDGAAVRDMAVAGLGIALMSTWAAGPELARGDLITVLPERSVISDHAIWALYPSSRLVSPKVRAVIDFLVERFSPVPYWDA